MPGRFPLTGPIPLHLGVCTVETNSTGQASLLPPR